jgi:hypothetical protein
MAYGRNPGFAEHHFTNSCINNMPSPAAQWGGCRRAVTNPRTIGWTGTLPMFAGALGFLGAPSAGRAGALLRPCTNILKIAPHMPGGSHP